jgi:predicted DCC family thiol-disulfide oxidoreductase YuxK
VSVPPSANPVLLYDGVCGLCNRLVQFILRHDDHDRFRFAALQSPLASRLLERHGASAANLDTFYIATNFDQAGEELLARSDAAVFVLQELGGGWRILGVIFRVLPRAVRDAVYNLIARNRYKVFGKFDSCPLPDPRHRHKFLE